MSGVQSHVVMWSQPMLWNYINAHVAHHPYAET